MLRTFDRDDLPRATVVPEEGTRISVVWIIPILAAVVAIGIAIRCHERRPDDYNSLQGRRGPRGRQDLRQV
jgi:hypothetical protein